MVHGNPECSYTYRHVVQGLEGSGARIVLPDHLGFGLSDQAPFQMIDMHHAANVARLVEALDLRDITLVVHDWGGPIGIGAFLDMPERVSRLVVLNTTIFPMPAEGYTYTRFPFPWLAWSWTPHLIPTALWGGVAAAVVPHAEPQGTLPFLRRMASSLTAYARHDLTPGSPEYVFAEQFRTPANSRASKRHVRQTPVWGHGYSYEEPSRGVVDNTSFYRRMQDELMPAWRDLPAVGFFGGWDACGKPEVIAQWQAAMPRMSIETFPDNGHFIEEHRGPEIAEGIRDLLAG